MRKEILYQVLVTLTVSAIPIITVLIIFGSTLKADLAVVKNDIEHINQNLLNYPEIKTQVIVNKNDIEDIKNQL